MPSEEMDAEPVCWTAFAAALIVAFGSMALEAPWWVANIAIAAAFICGLSAGLLSMRRRWNGN
jgi:hypothetical protein